MNISRKVLLAAVFFAGSTAIQANPTAHTSSAIAVQPPLDPVMDGGSPINFTKGGSYGVNVADPVFLKDSITAKFQLDTIVKDGKTSYESKFNVTAKGTNSLSVDNQKKSVLQFHLHAPGEHKVEGQSFALEAHFVHNNTSGDLTVVGVLFKEGKRNKGIDQLIKQVQKRSSKPFNLKISSILPVKDARMYRYHGSLTAHSFAKNVQWLVFQKVLEVSKEQLQQLQSLRMVNTAREIQELGSRAVVRDTHID